MNLLRRLRHSAFCILHSAFRRQPLAPIPFEPFHPQQLSPEEVQRALADRQDDPVVRSVMQVLQGNMRAAVRDMALGKKEGKGAWLALEETWNELNKLVRGSGKP